MPTAFAMTLSSMTRGEASDANEVDGARSQMVDLDEREAPRVISETDTRGLERREHQLMVRWEIRWMFTVIGCCYIRA